LKEAHCIILKAALNRWKINLSKQRLKVSWSVHVCVETVGITWLYCEDRGQKVEKASWLKSVVTLIQNFGNCKQKVHVG